MKLFLKENSDSKTRSFYKKNNILIFVVLKDLTSYFPKSPNIEQSLLESFQPAKCKIEGKKGENVYFFDYFSRSVSVCKKRWKF